jgi:energy-coupling factor transporter ATP-binding protein EcfA2
MNTADPRGSIWRRWDLHVHTPDSFENNFGGWDAYLAAARAVKDVSALGVTDYFFIDGYRKLRELRAAGDLSNFELILPNIELRLGTFVPKRSDGSQLKRLNFHVIFSDELSPDVIEQQFIQALHFQIEGHPEDERGTRNVTRQAIEEAGRLVKKHQATFAGDTDFVAGCKVITFDLTEALKVLQKNCFTGKYILFLASENWDQIAWGGQDYLVRKNLLQTSHGLFCGQRNTIDWCLGRHGGEMSAEKFIQEFGALKPCIYGSDAHTVDKLCRPDDDKFCWIKADVTFEGLRQIIYEPADRVYIGPTPPIFYDHARVIRSVIVSNADGWFDEVEIPLNPGLVSIIGQKGSGKSALAELIAHAADSWETDEAGSFIRRAGPLINDLSMRLKWLDDTETNARLGDEQIGEKRVRYLSQKFVDRLCTDDHIGTELIHEIEAVIFACTDPTETLNASDFRELRAIRTEAIRAEAERLREDVIRLIREECSLMDNSKKLGDKKARIKNLQDEETGLVKQMPKAATPEEQRAQAQLLLRRTALAALQQAVAADKQRIQKASDIRTRVSAFNAQIGRFVQEINALLNEAGVPQVDRAAFWPAFPGDTEGPLARRTEALQASIAKQEGALERPVEGTINWLQSQITSLTVQESADKARQDRIRTIQTRIAAIGTEVARLRNEVAQIEGPEKDRRAAAYEERVGAYVGYFGNLRLEHEALEELYAPVKKKLTERSASTQEQDLEFSIRWEADIDKWLQRGSALFDQRKTLPYGTFQALTKAARDILMPAWTSGDPEKIRPAHEVFSAEFRKRDPRPREYLRTDANHKDLIEWLYEVDHIQLNYGLKYNGVDLAKLSPGTKGIVLLILYLGMDTVDTRPLIVDQPDENLDNESIYKLLTRYFKEAKTRRQIILITHNPNLVVNADSEQVIIANCARRANDLPHITYKSGALENTGPNGTGIREQACRILEGGSDAFRKREQRYSLPSK